jgi:hypothetical protein
MWLGSGSAPAQAGYILGSTWSHENLMKADPDLTGMLLMSIYYLRIHERSPVPNI